MIERSRAIHRASRATSSDAMMSFNDQDRKCHPERSEGSISSSKDWLSGLYAF